MLNEDKLLCEGANSLMKSFQVNRQAHYVLHECCDRSQMSLLSICIALGRTLEYPHAIRGCQLWLLEQLI